MLWRRRSTSVLELRDRWRSECCTSSWPRAQVDPTKSALRAAPGDARESRFLSATAISRSGPREKVNQLREISRRQGARISRRPAARNYTFQEGTSLISVLTWAQAARGRSSSTTPEKSSRPDRRSTRHSTVRGRVGPNRIRRTGGEPADRRCGRRLHGSALACRRDCLRRIFRPDARRGLARLRR